LLSSPPTKKVPPIGYKPISTLPAPVAVSCAAAASHRHEQQNGSNEQTHGVTFHF
jgi:hypothetical protein